MKKKILATILTCLTLSFSASVMAENWVNVGIEREYGSEIVYALDTDSIERGKNDEKIEFALKIFNTDENTGAYMLIEENTVDNMSRTKAYRVLQNGKVVLNETKASKWQELGENIDFYDEIHQVIAIDEIVKPIGGYLTNSVPLGVLDTPDRSGWELVTKDIEDYSIDFKTVNLDKVNNKIYAWSKYDNGVVAWAFDLRNLTSTVFAVGDYEKGRLAEITVNPWNVWLPLSMQTTINDESLEAISFMGSVVFASLYTKEDKYGRKLFPITEMTEAGQEYRLGQVQ